MKTKTNTHTHISSFLMCACVRRLEWAFKQEHPQFKPHFEQEQSIYEGALDWLICILMDRPDLFSSVAEHLRTNEPFVSFRVLQALHHILKVLFDIYLYICYSLFFFYGFYFGVDRGFCAHLRVPAQELSTKRLPHDQRAFCEVVAFFFLLLLAMLWSTPRYTRAHIHTYSFINGKKETLGCIG